MGGSRAYVRSTRAGRLGWIEACRGLAATAVVLYHTVRHFDKTYGLPMLERFFQFGHAGVDLFFVISGFIILFVHFDDIGKPERLKHYVKRRTTRILPIYWVALALTVPVALARGLGITVADIGWALVPVPINAQPIVGVTWTLQFELVFYAVFAVLIANRAAGLAVLATWLALILAAFSWTGLTRLPLAYFGAFNLEFFGGMAVAYLLRRRTVPWHAVIAGLSIAAFAAVAIAEGLGWIDGYAVPARFAYGLPAMGIVLGAAEASRQGAIAVPALLRRLGSASYSLYLFQFLFIGVSWQALIAAGLTTVVPPVLGCTIVFGIAMIGGVLLSQWIEYPLMRAFRTALDRPASNKKVIARLDVPGR